jgi:hypothetical protein
MKSVKNIQKITKAMKMVAASKLRAVQTRTENSRGLWQPFTALLGDAPSMYKPSCHIWYHVYCSILSNCLISPVHIWSFLLTSFCLLVCICVYGSFQHVRLMLAWTACNINIFITTWLHVYWCYLGFLIIESSTCILVIKKHQRSLSFFIINV